MAAREGALRSPGPSQIMVLCLSPFKERVSVINGKNTKYKKTKSALIKGGDENH